MNLLQILKDEWALVSGAPFTIAAITVAIWLVVRLIYKDRLSSAKELLELKSSQLTEIQDRTGAKSPE
ncbi:hypothetical protein, partial [Tateyamaria sp.]